MTPNHNTIELRRGTRVQFTYTNYKGETATRRAIVLGLFYGSNEYHPEPQFLMSGIDLDKAAPRGYALKDISELELIAREKVSENRISRIYHPEEHEDIQISYIEKGQAEIQTTTFPKSAKKYAIKFQQNMRKKGAVIIRGIEE